MAPLFGDPFDFVFFAVCGVALLHVLRLLALGAGGPGVLKQGERWKPVARKRWKPVAREMDSDSPSAVAPAEQAHPERSTPDEPSPPEAPFYPQTPVHQDQLLGGQRGSAGAQRPLSTQNLPAPAHAEPPRALLVRPPGRTLWLVVCLTLAVLAFIRGAMLWDRYDKVFVLYGAVVGVFGLWQYRIRVEADAHRLLVVNLLRSFTLRWDKIEEIGTIADYGDNPDPELAAVRTPEGYIRAHATLTWPWPWPGGKPVQARLLAAELHAHRDVALQAPVDDGARPLHRVPTLRPWQRRALGAGVPLTAAAIFVWVIGSSPLRVSPENLSVGDCFRSQDFTQYDIEVVACSEPHDVQVIAGYTVLKTDYEGEDAAVDAALDLCEDEFRTRVGREPKDVTLEAWGTWDDNEVVGHCLAVMPTEVATSLPGLSP